MNETRYGLLSWRTNQLAPYSTIKPDGTRDTDRFSTPLELLALEIKRPFSVPSIVKCPEEGGSFELCFTLLVSKPYQKPLAFLECGCYIPADGWSIAHSKEDIDDPGTTVSIEQAAAPAELMTDMQKITGAKGVQWMVSANASDVIEITVFGYPEAPPNPEEFISSLCERLR